MNYIMNHAINLPIIILVFIAVYVRQKSSKMLFWLLISIAAIAQLVLSLGQKNNPVILALELFTFVLVCFLADFIVAEVRDRIKAKKKS